MDKTELKTAIVDAIRKLTVILPLGRSNREWTATLKRELVELGSRFGYVTCAGGRCGDNEPEWLFDVVWYRNHSGHLAELAMVAESEWSWHHFDLRYDFEKLLVAKCSLKLMVFQGNEATLEEALGLMRKGIEVFNAPRSGETYILACYLNGKHEFHFEEIET